MRRVLTIAFALIAAAPAFAADDAKQQKIDELIRTIKVQDMFEQQIAQGRASYIAIGKKMFAHFQDQIGPSVDPERRARLETAFQRYLDRAMTFWKAEDLAAVWSARFGQDLSEDDLDQLLAFYRTPVGPKIVAANQAANNALTEAVSTQSQIRINAALDQLSSDLKEAAGK
jgi:hypothetical protein